MARKSRRQSQVTEEMLPQERVFKAGLCVRLSIQDIRDRKDSDSIENPENSNDGLIISLKNLLNDIYTKDISKKLLLLSEKGSLKENF